MTAIRIVHCSDLHFGSPNQKAVWTSLLSDINGMKPHLVLVTGDVVHTTKRQLYEAAKDALAQLAVAQGSAGVPYLVCPGNHDRHVLGNAPGAFSGLVHQIVGYSGAAAWFDSAFVGRIPTLDDPRDLVLTEGQNSWRLRVIGIDTSSEARYSAQGYAPLADIEKLPDVARGLPDADLVLVMHHHHLLSIAELERLRQSPKQLLAPTVMLNSGTMLRALARGTIDVVLHGHEHQRAAARFGTLEGEQAQTVILGAGSGTGNGSLDGCEVRRASYNLIELRPDRSVHVRERGHEGAGWVDRGPFVQLLDGTAIRRSRFYRRARREAPATSRITESFEFRADRNIDLTQTWTDWAVQDGRWGYHASNSSGLPGPATVRFDWTQGPPQTFADVPFRPLSGIGTGFGFRVQTGRAGTASADRIELRYRWIGGGVLTRDDLDYVPRQQRDEFRQDGREAASVEVVYALRSLSMLVRLPAAFAPRRQDVRVVYSGPAAGAGAYEESPELREALQHHAPGLFSIEIPFPIPGYTYTLTWPISASRPASRAASRFSAAAGGGACGSGMLTEFGRHLVRAGIMPASLALYLPTRQPGCLAKVAEQPGGGGRIGPAPDLLSLHGESALYRHAWWGETQRAIRDPDGRDIAFGLDEHALVVVPVRNPNQDADETWALVRLAFQEPDGDGELLKRLTSATIDDSLSDAAVSMLHAASSTG